MAKKPDTMHVALDEETREHMKKIQGVLRMWGASATASAAVRFALLRTGRNITDLA